MSTYETVMPKHDAESCTRVPCGRCRPQGKPQVPTVGPNPHDAAAPPEPPDAVVKSIGLAKHLGPHDLAAELRKAARILEEQGMDAEYRAPVLAARGYSSQTLGDGGSRGTDSTSSTERHAGVTQECKPADIRLDQWAGVDARLATAMATMQGSMRMVVSLVTNINHHASDVDPIPVGQGECMACGRTCRPTVNPNDRLRSGLCNACRMAFTRRIDPLMMRADWIRERRATLTDAKGVLHQPQPEVDGHTA